MDMLLLVEMVGSKPKLLFITQHLTDVHNLDMLEKCIVKNLLFSTKDVSNSIYVSAEEAKELYAPQLTSIYQKMISEGTNGQILYTDENVSFYSFSFSIKDKDKKRIFSFLVTNHNYQYLCHIQTFIHQNLTQFVQDLKYKAKQRDTKWDKGELSFFDLVGIIEFRETIHIFASVLLRTISTKLNLLTPTKTHRVDSRFKSFKNLLKISKMDDREVLYKIVYNVIVGNQIIIRSKQITLCNELVNLLVTLIPQNLVRAKYGATEYVASFNCNFLTLTHESKLDSNDIDFGSCVLIDMNGSFDQLDHFSIVFEGKVLNLSLLAKLDSILNVSHEESIEESTISLFKMQCLHLAKLLRNCKDKGEVDQFLRIFKLSNEDELILRYFGTSVQKKR